MTTVYEKRMELSKKGSAHDLMKKDSSRITSMMVGALVADCASMGTHWIYDPAELATTVGDTEHPEFLDPPSPQYYSSTDYPGHYLPGMPSPWGEQLVWAMSYVGQETCVTTGHMAISMKKWAETFGGRQDSATKEFLKCMVAGDRSVELCGAEDDQAHCYMKVVPVVALYVGELDMLDRVKEAILVHQTNQTAIHFGQASATLLEALLMGETLKVSLEKVVEFAIAGGHDEVMDACLRALSEAKSKKSLEELMVAMTEENLGGRSCHFPAAFIIPLFQLYQIVADHGDKIPEQVYMDAIRANILAAGDTCSRAVLLGAVLGAAIGKVPQEWQDKTHAESLKEAKDAAAAIVDVLN